MRRRKVMELKNIKVQKAFEEFLEEHKAKNTSDNTLDTYKLHIDSFMDITDCQWLTTAMLDKSFYTYFITELQEEGRKKDTTIASYLLSVKLDAPAPCRLDAPDLDLICYASADCLHQHLQVI